MGSRSEAEKNRALLASLTGKHAMHRSGFAGQKQCLVATLAGKEVIPCSAFAGQRTWCARVHGFARPRDSRLSEMSWFVFVRYRPSAFRELGSRDHRNEATGQSPRHGASGMKRTLRTDARGYGATPPGSASISITAIRIRNDHMLIDSPPYKAAILTAVFVGVK